MPIIVFLKIYLFNDLFYTPGAICVYLHFVVPVSFFPYLAYFVSQPKSAAHLAPLGAGRVGQLARRARV